MSLSPEDKALLKALYNKLDDRPLEPNSEFYVPFQRLLHTGTDPIAELGTRIAWSNAASVHLLSGQRGSGKSTELRRLREMLQAEGCKVILCDMRDYMNLTKPVEITDFLISIMAALTDELHTGDSALEASLRDTFQQRIIDFINDEVKLEGMKAELGEGPLKVGIGASLKEDSSFKKKLQEGLRGHVARLVKQTHDFAAEVVAKVRKLHQDDTLKVVLLVDSVEQLRAEAVDEANALYKSVENLFFTHADALHIPLLHVVYTVPPYLVPLVPGLGRVLGGGTISSLSSIKVRNQAGQEDTRGLEIMQNIMEKRSSDWEKVFTRDQLRRMALSTGGDLRDFFRLSRDCLIKAVVGTHSTLPLPEKILTDSENHLRREMLPLAEADMHWLRQIAETKKPVLKEIQFLPQFARFLDTHLVLNYRNGDDWYDVHPLLLKELKLESS